MLRYKLRTLLIVLALGPPGLRWRPVAQFSGRQQIITHDPEWRMLPFTIVLLTLVVALAVGWWIDRRRLARKVSESRIDYAVLKGTIYRLEIILDETDKDWRDK